MAEPEKTVEEHLEVIEQHIVDAQQEENSLQQSAQDSGEQQVTIIITHSGSSNVTKEESLSPKSQVSVVHYIKGVVLSTDCLYSFIFQESHSVGVQTQTDPQPLYNVIPDDGSMGYDDGVRVLRAIGSWYV